MSQHLVHFGGTTRPAPFWPLLALFHAHSACTSPATATTGHSFVDVPGRAQRPRTRDREPSQDSDLLFTLFVDVNGEGTRTRHDCTVVSHSAGRQRSLSSATLKFTPSQGQGRWLSSTAAGEWLPECAGGIFSWIFCSDLLIKCIRGSIT